jgi:hypothetical protein
MSNTKIMWYSMTQDLAAEEREPVELAEALRIVDRYLARRTETFASAEESLAGTMFGFSRSASDFIEICVHGPTKMSYKFEAADPNASWFRKLFKGVFQHEEELHSREELVHKVEEFFRTPVAEIRRRLEG